VILTFKNKGLQELSLTGKSAKIGAKLQSKILRILDALHQAKTLDAMNIPGFGFHGLKGITPKRYALSVNGPWRITFEFEGENAIRVDFEQYH
jgi:proteic killer suppression protein